MNAVLHRPVAEQYPSSTATVSALASNRISGMVGYRKRKPGPAEAGPEKARAACPSAREEIM